ncbi:hypothetical protein Agub_g12010, partial [Astrephomene gubernaculifera]
MWPLSCFRGFKTVATKPNPHKKYIVDSPRSSVDSNPTDSAAEFLPLYEVASLTEEWARAQFPVACVLMEEQPESSAQPRRPTVLWSNGLGAVFWERLLDRAVSPTLLDTMAKMTLHKLPSSQVVSVPRSTFANQLPTTHLPPTELASTATIPVHVSSVRFAPEQPGPLVPHALLLVCRSPLLPRRGSSRRGMTPANSNHPDAAPSHRVAFSIPEAPPPEVRQESGDTAYEGDGHQVPAEQPPGNCSNNNSNSSPNNLASTDAATPEVGASQPHPSQPQPQPSRTQPSQPQGAGGRSQRVSPRSRQQSEAARRQRDSMVAAHLPAAITVFTWEGRVLHQNPASVQYMGAMPSVPPAAAAAAAAVPAATSSPAASASSTLGALRGALLRGGASLGLGQAVGAVGAAGEEQQAAAAATAVTAASRGMLDIVFKYEKAKLTAMLETLQGQAAIWQGIVRVPSSAEIRQDVAAAQLQSNTLNRHHQQHPHQRHSRTHQASTGTVFGGIAASGEVPAGPQPSTHAVAAAAGRKKGAERAASHGQIPSPLRCRGQDANGPGNAGGFRVSSGRRAASLGASFRAPLGCAASAPERQQQQQQQQLLIQQRATSIDVSSAAAGLGAPRSSTAAAVAAAAAVVTSATAPVTTTFQSQPPPPPPPSRSSSVAAAAAAAAAAQCKFLQRPASQNALPDRSSASPPLAGQAAAPAASSSHSRARPALRKSADAAVACLHPSAASLTQRALSLGPIRRAMGHLQGQLPQQLRALTSFLMPPSTAPESGKNHNHHNHSHHNHHHNNSQQHEHLHQQQQQPLHADASDAFLCAGSPGTSGSHPYCGRRSNVTCSAGEASPYVMSPFGVAAAAAAAAAAATVTATSGYDGEADPLATSTWAVLAERSTRLRRGESGVSGVGAISSAVASVVGRTQPLRRLNSHVNINNNINPSTAPASHQAEGSESEGREGDDNLEAIALGLARRWGSATQRYPSTLMAPPRLAPHTTHSQPQLPFVLSGGALEVVAAPAPGSGTGVVSVAPGAAPAAKPPAPAPPRNSSSSNHGTANNALAAGPSSTNSPLLLGGGGGLLGESGESSPVNAGGHRRMDTGVVGVPRVLLFASSLRSAPFAPGGGGPGGYSKRLSYDFSKPQPYGAVATPGASPLISGTGNAALMLATAPAGAAAGAVQAAAAASAAVAVLGPSVSAAQVEIVEESEKSAEDADQGIPRLLLSLPQAVADARAGSATAATAANAAAAVTAPAILAAALPRASSSSRFPHPHPHHHHLHSNPSPSQATGAAGSDAAAAAAYTGPALLPPPSASAAASAAATSSGPTTHTTTSSSPRASNRDSPSSNQEEGSSRTQEQQPPPPAPLSRRLRPSPPPSPPTSKPPSSQQHQEQQQQQSLQRQAPSQQHQPPLSPPQHQQNPHMQQQQAGSGEVGPPQTQAADSPGVVAEVWHQVAAVTAVDPVSGALVLVITQVDVTAKVRAERHLAHVMCAERRLLMQLFPRHVLNHIVESNPLLRSSACLEGPGGGSSSSGRPQQQQQQQQHPPQDWQDGGGWRPALHDADKLATMHPQATVLFADVAGFDDICRELPPQRVLAFLNDLFAKFDDSIEPFGVHKMETIGGLFIVAGGLLRQEADGAVAVRERWDPLHAEKVFMFAKAMLNVAARTKMPNTDEPVKLRIGIHTGPVVSGIVGLRVPRFVLFGDTVNTASRMQTSCTPGTLHVSDDTRRLLRHECWTPTGGVQIKGKGLLHTYVWSPEDPIHFLVPPPGASSTTTTGSTRSALTLTNIFFASGVHNHHHHNHHNHNHHQVSATGMLTNGAAAAGGGGVSGGRPLWAINHRASVDMSPPSHHQLYDTFN